MQVLKHAPLVCNHAQEHESQEDMKLIWADYKVTNKNKRYDRNNTMHYNGAAHTKGRRHRHSSSHDHHY